jgi:hypothetical protein
MRQLPVIGALLAVSVVPLACAPVRSSSARTVQNYSAPSSVRCLRSHRLLISDEPRGQFDALRIKVSRAIYFAFTGHPDGYLDSGSLLFSSGNKAARGIENRLLESSVTKTLKSTPNIDTRRLRRLLEQEQDVVGNVIALWNTRPPPERARRIVLGCLR